MRLFFLEEDPSVNVLEVWKGADGEEKGGKTFGELEEDEFLTAHVQSSKSFYSLEEGTSFSLDWADLLRQLMEQGGEEISSTTETFLSYFEPTEVTAAGSVTSPLIFGVEGEPSYIQEEGVEIPDVANALSGLNTVSGAYYFSFGLIPTYAEALLQAGIPETSVDLMLAIAGLEADETLLPRGDLYIALPERGLFEPFGEGYESYVEEEKAAISELLGEDIEFITLNDNFSVNSLNSYSVKVTAIGTVLMAAFVFVTALVVLSNMTRLMEEDADRLSPLARLFGFPHRLQISAVRGDRDGHRRHGRLLRGRGADEFHLFRLQL